MSNIRTTKIDGQEFVTLTDYLKLKEEKQELEYLGDINEELKEENKKLKEEVKDLVERNIELNKKYMLVLTENKKLEEERDELKKEFQQYKEHYNTEKDKQQIFLMTGLRY